MTLLGRFHEAQDAGGSFIEALDELHHGRKTSHWIWWVFPQLRGLGQSANSWRFGIEDGAEARAYLADPVLGLRLRESVTAMLDHAAGSRPAEWCHFVKQPRRPVSLSRGTELGCAG